MSFPSSPARSFRLSGLAIVLSLVALLASPLGSPGRAAVGPATDPAWQWPVGDSRAVTRSFEAPPTRYAAGHRGIDVAAPVGTPVLSPADGVVHFAGMVAGRPVVSIRHPGGLISSFEPVESALAAGAAVSAGSAIGSTIAGHCRSPCLHFGVRLNGEYVSPLVYLESIPAPVLLPTRPFRD